MVTTSELHQVRVEEQDLTSGDLTLTADTGESIEILARGIDSGADEDVIEERVEEVTMLNYQADEGDDEIFPRDVVDNQNQDILHKMRTMGADLPTLKVPAGTDYQLNNPNDNGSAVVLYRDLDTERFARDSPGGPESRTRTFISNGTGTASSVGTTTTVTQEIDTSENIGGIESWPWEEDVPDGREYDVYAIGFELDSSTESSRTLDNFRLTSAEQDFLENDAQLVRNELAQYPNNDLTTMPWVWVDEDGGLDPITYSSGDDLTVEVEVTNSNTTSAQDVTVKSFIVARERRV